MSKKKRAKKKTHEHVDPPTPRTASAAIDMGREDVGERRDRTPPDAVHAAIARQASTPAPTVEDVLTAVEAAQILRISAEKARDLLSSGKIRGVVVGRHWRTTRGAVLRYLEGGGA